MDVHFLLGEVMQGFSKGVSPIIATIILIIISVAAGALLWLWVSGYVSSSQMPSQAAWYERIKIDAVNVVSKNELNVYVRNLGNTAVKIASAYILTVDGVAIDSVTIEPSISIEPQKVKEVKLTIRNSSVYSPGYTYIVKVITSSGVEASYGFVWPALIE
ncbi:MAG: archaellin/type IV pilin N-terminal domain-containing protein [Ignisphaera sp.]|uniref:Flagellar biosynthesis protein FlaG n=2 Tax=Ignisphaera aggregans TaxID=334771 RepID=A0A7J3I8P4_9CREN